MERVTPRPRARPTRAPLLDPLLCRAAPAGGRRKRGDFHRAQQAIFVRAERLGLIDLPADTVVAVDATGLATRHTSNYYQYRYSALYAAVYAGVYAARHEGQAPRRARRARRRHPRRLCPKLTAVVHTSTHLIAGAVLGHIPSNDVPALAPALTQACAVLAFTAAVADRGYDAEHCHQFCHETLGLTRTAIKLNHRGVGRRWPKQRYRRAMRRAFPHALYGERQQAESTFSQHKRILGDALTARGEAAQQRELVLRVLTHNLLILHCCVNHVSTEPLSRSSAVPQFPQFIIPSGGRAAHRMDAATRSTSASTRRRFPLQIFAISSSV